MTPCREAAGTGRDSLETYTPLPPPAPRAPRNAHGGEPGAGAGGWGLTMTPLFTRLFPSLLEKRRNSFIACFSDYINNMHFV